MKSLHAKFLVSLLVLGATGWLSPSSRAITFVQAQGGWSSPFGPGAGAATQENLGGPYQDPQPAPPGPNKFQPTGIRWGVPSTSGTNPEGFRSGLRFFGADFNSAPVNIPDDGSTFTISNIFEIDHINFPVNLGTQLTGVDLVIGYDFETDGGSPFSVIQTIPVAIDETPNTEPCDPPSSLVPPRPCPDVITLTEPSVSVIPINGGPEFIELTLSFPTTGTNQIITEERQQNPFFIDATFRRAPAPLPIGAAGALSLFAGGFRRLRKRYAAVTSDHA